MSNSFFKRCCTEIEAEYARLGHTLGWRFLSGRKSTLACSSGVALITLNPGGDGDPPGYPRCSQERGSAYLVESWDGKPPGQSKLQRQVIALFSHLAARQGLYDPEALIGLSLVGHFIPFRSPSFDRLGRKSESIAFGQRLWTTIFEHITPKLVITMGHATFKNIEAIIRAKHPGHQQQRQKLPTGWGSYAADIVTFHDHGTKLKLVRLPHLSRFGIFNRDAGRAAIAKLIDTISDE